MPPILNNCSIAGARLWWSREFGNITKEWMPGCWGDLGLISGKVPGRRCMRKGCFLSASQHVFPDFPHVPAEGVLRLRRRLLDIPFLHFSSHLEKEFLLVGSVFFADGGESQLRPREAAFEKERQIVLPGAPEVFRASFCSDGEIGRASCRERV